MRIEQAADEFLASKRQAGLRKLTVKQYQWHLRELASYLAASASAELGEVRISDMRRWGGELYERWSPATIKTAVVVARSFFAWCVTEGLLAESPAARLKTPTVKLKVLRTLGAAEVAALLAACDLAEAKGIRDAAIIAMLADSGLRANELLSLTPADLNLPAGQCVVVRKGGQQSVAFFGRATAVRLQAWLAVRQAAPGERALWVSVGGGKPRVALTEHGLRMMLRRAGRCLGMEGISPHAFRRGWACMLVEAGAPPRYIQGAGGWTSERQIYRYTQALDLQRMAPQYSPLDRMGSNGNGSETPGPTLAVQLPLWAEWPHAEK